MEDTCLNCRFFKGAKECEEIITPDGVSVTKLTGECRRKSPFKHHTWPIIYATDSCGEYKTKEEKINWGDIFYPRVVNGLRRAGIETLEDLKSQTDAQLADIKYLGRKSLDEIKKYLEEK